MEESLIDVKLKSIYFFTTPSTLSENSLFITNKTSRTLNIEFALQPQPQHFKSFDDDALANFNIMEKRCQLLDVETKCIPLSFVSKQEGLYTAHVLVTVNKTATYKVDLFGYVYDRDENIRDRLAIDEYLQRLSADNFFAEILDDIIGEVKTSPPPLPDYSNDSELRAERFNAVNHSGGYVYDKKLYERLREERALLLGAEKQYWDLSIAELKKFVRTLGDPDNEWQVARFYCLLHYIRCQSVRDQLHICEVKVA